MRSIYVLALLSTAIPAPISPWVGMALGKAGMPMILQVPALAIMAIAIWRLVGVIRDPHRLDTPEHSGIVSTCRSVAVWLMTLGAVVAAMQWCLVPLARLLFAQRSDSGIEYFAVGLGLAVIAPLAPLGVILFEATRVSSLETWYQSRQPSATTDGVDE